MYHHPPALAYKVTGRSIQKLRPQSGAEFEYHAVMAPLDRAERPLSNEAKEQMNLDTVARPPPVGTSVTVHMCSGGMLLKEDKGQAVPVIFVPGTFTQTFKLDTILLFASYPSPELSILFQSPELARRFEEQVTEVCHSVAKCMIGDFQRLLGNSLWLEGPVLECPEKHRKTGGTGEFICGLNGILSAPAPSKFQWRCCRRVCGAWVELWADGGDVEVRAFNCAKAGGWLHAQSLPDLPEDDLEASWRSRQAQSGSTVGVISCDSMDKNRKSRELLRGHTVTFESPELASTWLELGHTAVSIAQQVGDQTEAKRRLEEAKRTLVEAGAVAAAARKKDDGGLGELSPWAETPSVFVKVPGAQFDIVGGTGCLLDDDDEHDRRGAKGESSEERSITEEWRKHYSKKLEYIRLAFESDGQAEAARAYADVSDAWEQEQ